MKIYESKIIAKIKKGLTLSIFEPVQILGIDQESPNWSKVQSLKDNPTLTPRSTSSMWKIAVSWLN